MLAWLAAVALSVSAAPVKIIVDAGSTGTRVYRVELKGCDAPAVETVGSGGPLASSEAGALRDILARTIARRPELTGLPVTVIGTGGFRRLDGGDAQTCASLCALKREEIARAAGPQFPGIKVRVVTGEEEGLLSHKSVVALTGDKRSVMVEIGGATVQVAYPDAAGNVRARMAAIGVNETLRKVPACAAPTTFEACRAGIEAMTAADPDAAALLSSPIGSGPVVGVGGAFNAVAAGVRLSGGSLSSRLDDVKELASRACRGQGTRADSCAMLSLQTLLIERFGIGGVAQASLEVGAALDGEDADCGR